MTLLFLSLAPFLCLVELRPEQAGYPAGQEGDKGHRGARLCHQEDPFQDGGRGWPALAAPEVVPVL